MSRCWIGPALALATTLGTARADDRSDGVAFFEAKIRPVLVERCYKCHSARTKKAPKAGLRLDHRDGLLQGGDSGPAIEPGRPDDSLLIRVLDRTSEVAEMPPGDKLPDPVIADFRKWIELGAPDPRRDEPDPRSASDDGRDWWSLRPLARPTVPTPHPEDAPQARSPIDAFLLTRLRDRGLTPAPEADRRTLIRRLTFDLTGLPPTPSEISVFMADDAPDAYERLVDRLLASPHYGERWARHWMDAVHFAETHGHDQDRIRPNAWPYRDYLIGSFNRDTPYARFIQEQLAADVIFPDEPQLTVALGFIAAGPWDESSLRDIREDAIDRAIGHYLDRDDMVATTMSTFVSSTVHCARCHDHKFDPITQADYYGLQADFAGVERANRAFDPDPEVHRRRLDLAARLLALYDRQWNPLADLIEPRAQETESARELEAQLAALPPMRFVYAGAADFLPDASHKPPGGPRPVNILKRGDIHNPGPLAVPGALACVVGLPSRFEIPETADEGARRAALARWISDPANPLTWRSIVNRVWQHHFGRGLVDTPDDFGRMGSLPSHPALLDWLAVEFRDGGGSIKRLQRLIVTSAAYRRSTRHDPKAAALDSEDRLLWRQNRRRLDAESARDAILAISGRLDTTMGGPSIQQFKLSPGVHVTPVVDYSQYDWESPGSGRRAVYRFLFRTLPDPFLDTLDAADASQLTAVRNESITPLQALALLNNPFMTHQAEHFAQRLDALGGDLESKARAAFELAFGRPPSVEEARELAEFAAAHGLSEACRLIFNSSEFLFID